MQLPRTQPRGSSAARGYGWRWQKASKTYLRSHPLCVSCQKQDKTVAATIVDHVIPHRGDQKLFWDEANWQSSCETCHNSAKQREEKSGIVVGSTTDGMPLDPTHPWNQKPECQADDPNQPR